MAVTEEKTQQEPSMEEILSSIRRIISAEGEEDTDKQATSEPEPEPQPEAAEQSEEAPMDRQAEIDTLFDDAPASEPAAETEEPEDDVLELTETVEEEEEESEVEDQGEEEAPAEPEPEPEIEDGGDEPVAAVAEHEPEQLVSPTTEAASVASLSTFADAVTGEARDFGGISVEQLAAELMRPMLREWLDRNLPGMVESLVRAEIRRLAEQAKR